MTKYIPIYKPIKGMRPIEPIIEGVGDITPGGGDGIDGGTSMITGDFLGISVSFG